jgi:hypothetical protein
LGLKREKIGPQQGLVLPSFFAFRCFKRKVLAMNKFEQALVNIANGAKEVRFSSFLDSESVHCLMAACSAASSKVKILHLASCDLDVQAVETIASSLRSNSIAALYLGYNLVCPFGAKALSEMLMVNVTLKTLFLHNSCIMDAGAVHLAVALQQNRSLEELHLGRSGIGHDGAGSIAGALISNPKLKQLDLSHNPLDDGGIVALSKAVPRSGLCKLVLNDMRLQERGCVALVKMLKNGSRLRELRVEGDHWPALEEGFRCNGWLLGYAPKKYVERNKAMHVQARKSVYTLLLIRKLRRTALSSFPKEMVREIAQFVYSTRGETKRRRK